MVDVIGTCIYCQQTRMVKVPKNAEQGIRDHEATMQCNCEGAKAYQNTETKIAVAQGTIKKRMVIKDELRDVLSQMAELVGHGYLDKVTCQKDGTTITIKDHKDSITVEKRIVTVESHKE